MGVTNLSIDGKCEYVATFQCLQFKKAPPTQCFIGSESFDWDVKVERAVNALIMANIDV